MIYFAQKTRLQQTRFRLQKVKRKGHRMTMARQNEFEPTLKRGEESILESASPDTDGTTIVRGYDYVPEQETNGADSHQEATYILDAIFDEYVKALRNPNLEYTYESGTFNTERTEDNPWGEPIPVMTTVSRDEILELKRADLSLYAKGSMSNGTLSFDAAALPKNGPITYDTICEAYVEDSISRAIERADRPSHIRAGEIDEEANNKFVEAIKGSYENIGSAAINALKWTASLFSGPITTFTPLDDDRIREAAPGHPANPEDLTGDTLTVTMKTVKPL